MKKERFYFDCASTTPISEAVFSAMKPYFKDKFGNAGSVHGFGQEAIGAIDKSREIIAKELNCDFREVVFTGSATEANNLALRGAILKWKNDFKDKIPFDFAQGEPFDFAQGEPFDFAPSKMLGINQGKPRIIVSAVEHDSVLEVARELTNEGIELRIVKVNKEGIVDLENLKELLTSNTVVVSVMLGNNEIGTIQPVKEIGELIKNFKEEEKNKATEFSGNIYPLFHTDVSQAFQYLKCDVEKLGVDLLTISSHKIYGPKGAGALFIKRFQKTKGFYIQPISSGGEQEFGMRPGTENVPAIVGFGEAVLETVKIREKELRRVSEIKAYFLESLKNFKRGLEINGNIKKSLPHIANVYFSRSKVEEIITALDLAGFAVSAGSACKARSITPSYVVEALGYEKERSMGSVRFSFGRMTTKKDVKKLLENLKELI